MRAKPTATDVTVSAKSAIWAHKSNPEKKTEMRMTWKEGRKRGNARQQEGGSGGLGVARLRKTDLYEASKVIQRPEGVLASSLDVVGDAHGEKEEDLRDQ